MVATIVAAIAKVTDTFAHTLSREFETVTYVVKNAGDPEWHTPEGAPIARDSAFVKSVFAEADKLNLVSQKDERIAKLNTLVLSIRGDIRKGKDISDLGKHLFTVSVEKFVHPAFTATIDDAGNWIITLPEFKRGAVETARAIDKSNPKTAALLAFAPKPVATPPIQTDGKAV